jgi:hypothetical protein
VAPCSGHGGVGHSNASLQLCCGKISRVFWLLLLCLCALLLLFLHCSPCPATKTLGCLCATPSAPHATGTALFARAPAGVQHCKRRRAVLGPVHPAAQAAAPSQCPATGGTFTSRAAAGTAGTAAAGCSRCFCSECGRCSTQRHSHAAVCGTAAGGGSEAEARAAPTAPSKGAPAAKGTCSSWRHLCHSSKFTAALVVGRSRSRGRGRRQCFSWQRRRHLWQGIQGPQAANDACRSCFNKGPGAA